jgi:hypothetical protein
MPRIPNAVFAEVPTPTYRPVAVDANAMAAPGRALAGLGNAMVQYAAEEQAEAEKLSAQDELNALERKSLDLTWGDKGYQKVTGPEVFRRPLVNEVSGELDRAISDGVSRLATPRAKAMYQQRAEQLRTSTLRGVLQHVAVQSDSAHAQTEKTTIELQAEKAAHDPAYLSTGLGLVNATLAQTFQRMGLNPRDDADQMDLMSRRAQGLVVGAAVKAMLSGDNPNVEGVEQIVKDYGKVIPQDQLAAIQTDLKHKSAWKLGNELTDTALEMEKSGVPDVEIRNYIRKGAGANKDAYTVADQLYRESLADIKRGREEVVGVFYDKFMTKKSLRTAQSIYNAPEFKALDGRTRADFRNFVEGELRQGSEWAYQDAQRAKALRAARYDTLDVWSKYYATVTSPDFGAMTPGQIMAKLPELGEDNVKRMLEANAHLRASGTNFQIDKDLINAATADFGKSSDKQKAEAAAKGRIEYNLTKWKTENPGRIPTQQEQERIIGDALRAYTIPRWYWTDKEGRAFQLKPVPGDFRAAATAAARKAGRSAPTEQEILNGWAMQKESRP